MPDAVLAPTRRPVLVLDFGSQYVQLIARRVRERRAFALIVRHDITAGSGPGARPDRPDLLRRAVERLRGRRPAVRPGRLRARGAGPRASATGCNWPARSLGGDGRARSPSREYGPAALRGDRRPTSPLLAEVPAATTVWMSHGDQVHDLGPDFVALAATPTLPAGRRPPPGPAGLRPAVPPGGQPHADGGPHPRQLPRPGLPGAPATGRWRRTSTRPSPRSATGSARTSGSSAGSPAGSTRRSRPPCWPGPSAIGSSASSSTTACCGPASGRRSSTSSAGTRRPNCGSSTPRDRFLGALAGVTDPQEKRVRIGHTFIDVFRDEAKSIPNARFLAQGTLYPDVIESGGSPDAPAATIKHHHNVGGLPAELGFELIEPLRDLFKDEVRRLGIELGLPEAPGLAAPVPGPRPGRPMPRRGDAGAAGGPPAGRLDLPGGAAGRRPGAGDRPGVRRAAAGAVGRGDGGRPDV